MSFHSKKNTNNLKFLQKGFTLMELLVSVGIVGVIATVVILNQSTYTDKAALSGLADEISLTVSQAQAYSIGVREFSPGTSNFAASYGLTFSLLSGNSGSPTAYLYFADRDGNKIYNGDWLCPVGGTSECLLRTDISRGNYIESICVVPLSGSDDCVLPKRADVTFTRPSTEAQIKFFNSADVEFVPASLKGVKVVLKSSSGSTRAVTVYTTGQISSQ